jgi:amino acid transporter
MSGSKKNIPTLILLIILIAGGLFFVAQGMIMHMNVADQDAALQQVQNAYFNVSKQERDNAPTGTVLNQQLVDIKNAPISLDSLKLVGLGKILTGIFLILLAILIAIITAPQRLANHIGQPQPTQRNPYQ